MPTKKDTLKRKQRALKQQISTFNRKIAKKLQESRERGIVLSTARLAAALKRRKEQYLALEAQVAALNAGESTKSNNLIKVAGVVDNIPIFIYKRHSRFVRIWDRDNRKEYVRKTVIPNMVIIPIYTADEPIAMFFFDEWNGAKTKLYSWDEVTDEEGCGHWCKVKPVPRTLLKAMPKKYIERLMENWFNALNTEFAGESFLEYNPNQNNLETLVKKTYKRFMHLVGTLEEALEELSIRCTNEYFFDLIRKKEVIKRFLK